MEAGRRLLRSGRSGVLGLKVSDGRLSLGQQFAPSQWHRRSYPPQRSLSPSSRLLLAPPTRQPHFHRGQDGVLQLAAHGKSVCLVESPEGVVVRMLPTGEP